jgi:hypothetical protein
MIIPTYLPLFRVHRHGHWPPGARSGCSYARAPRKAASLVAAWNVLCILDLIIAVGTGFMTAPSRFPSLEVQPTSELMTALSMVLIPFYTSWRSRLCCTLPRSPSCAARLPRVTAKLSALGHKPAAVYQNGMHKGVQQ